MHDQYKHALKQQTLPTELKSSSRNKKMNLLMLKKLKYNVGHQ